MKPPSLASVAFASALVALGISIDGALGRILSAAGTAFSMVNLWRLAAHRWPVVTYAHHRCATGRPCQGHRVRLTRAGRERIDAARAAGNLAYVGPGRRPGWLTRLTQEGDDQ